MLKKLIEAMKKYYEYFKKLSNHYLKYHDEIDWLVMAGVVVLIILCIYGIYSYEINK